MGFGNVQIAVMSSFGGVMLSIMALMFAGMSDSPRGPQITERTVFDRLQALSGATAIPCGTIARRQETKTATDCAREALRRGDPFWFAVQPQPGWLHEWHGVAVDGTGRAWRIWYDNSASCLPETHIGSIHLDRCLDTQVLAGPRAFVQCK